MKKALFFLLIISLFFSCKAKKEYNKIKRDKKRDNVMLYGYTNLEGLKKEPFNLWFDSEYEAYQADMQTIDLLDKEKLSETQITIVMGTWCGDSQREVPRFIKIIEYVRYHPNDITIINVDRKKTAKGTPVEKLKIERVPTFIFSKGEYEIGRIVESPTESLEKDMLKIIGG